MSSSGTEDAYQYQGIGHGGFRIFFLLEADCFDDDIEGAIFEESLPGADHDDMAYTALSYVWGAARDTHKVYIGDKELSIGKNLDSALRHLRRRDRPLRLWVDALCIDQGNVLERNHQVHEMRRIYESARETIIYLGDQVQNKTCESAWNFLERNSTWAQNEEQERDYTLPAKLDEELIDFRGDLHDVYHEVLSREWFTRVWVLQEIVVSKEVSVQCGYRRVPWDDLLKAIMTKKRSHDRYGESLRQESLFVSVARIWDARVAFHVGRDQGRYLPSWHGKLASNQETTTDILDMLVRARDLVASDLRDKVFALLGISTGFDWKAKQTIDYTIPPNLVYTLFARDYMVTAKDYRVLSYLNKDSDPSRLSGRIRHWSSLRMRCERALAVEQWFEDEQLYRTSILNLPNDATLEAQSGQAHKEGQSASIMLDECRSQLVYLNEQQALISRSGTVILPSWVPHWQGFLSTTYEPRPIIETVSVLPPGSNQSTLIVEEYRTFSPTLRSPLALFVHGRVLGRVSKMLSSTCLLGNDEAAFQDLREIWHQQEIYQSHSLDAQILTMWAHFLDATADLEENDYLQLARLSDLIPLSLRRRAAYSAKKVLGKAPGSRYPNQHMAVSFLDLFDVETCPPSAGSIEAHLVARGRKTVEWSDEDSPALSIVADRSSIIDRRQMGAYDEVHISDRRSIVASTMTLGDDDRPGSVATKSKPVLLPETAEFRDLIVYFPGAKVPFLVRTNYTDGILAARREVLSNLQHLDYTELQVCCKIIGECWISDFDETTEIQKKFDTVFEIS